jgi:hypothetical protein
MLTGAAAAALATLLALSAQRHGPNKRAALTTSATPPSPSGWVITHPADETPRRNANSAAAKPITLTAEPPSISAARRAFSPAFSITQRDVVPPAEPDADRNP